MLGICGTPLLPVGQEHGMHLLNIIVSRRLPSNLVPTTQSLIIARHCYRGPSTYCRRSRPFLFLADNETKLVSRSSAHSPLLRVGVPPRANILSVLSRRNCALIVKGRRCADQTVPSHMSSILARGPSTHSEDEALEKLLAQNINESCLFASFISLFGRYFR